jgi:alkane 1-monooxygenase
MRKINKYGYLLVFTIPISIVFSYYSNQIFTFYILPLFMFMVLPIIDPFVGIDNTNFDQTISKEIKEEKYYRYILYAWVLAQTTLMIWLTYIFITQEISIHLFILLLINTMIMNGGVGITIAHELGHKPQKLEKFLAKFLLIQVGYGYFYVEHNRGHHVHVATPNDPATAKKNQNYFVFWKQAVIGGFKNSIKIEKARLAKRKQRSNLWTNEAYRLTLISVVLLLSIGCISYLIHPERSITLLAFLILQAFLSFSLLEAVDYIEHYGIERKEISPGVYEKVNPKHSWNANFIYSNYFLFQLQRHADHHVYATKNYQLLDAHDESPQLPNGYPAMVILSLIPPLWFKLMNDRLEEWKNRTNE